MDMATPECVGGSCVGASWTPAWGSADQLPSWTQAWGQLQKQ